MMTSPKKIEIMGDSMLNNINKHGLSKTDDVNIINISGIKRKPDVMICHVGTNDIEKNFDTITNLQNVINKIKKKSSHTTVALSSVFKRLDRPEIDKKVVTLNAKLKMLCEENLITYIDNTNIDDTCLGKLKFIQTRKVKHILPKI